MRVRLSPFGGRATRLVAIACLVLGASAAAVRAQSVVEGTQELEFDRPESWAQAYFTSVTIFGGFGAPRAVAAGSVELSVEGGWVPSLSRAQRTVGFDGMKEEDLNKTSVFGRIRLLVGLPRNVSLTVGYTPPVTLDGATPDLLALSLARPVVVRDRFRLGVRLHGQTGTIEGDFTCPERAAAAGIDPVANPFSCEAASKDRFRPRYAGLEVSTAFPRRGRRVEPYLTASWNRMRSEFQVEARYLGLIDLTRQTTHGWTWSATAGARMAIGRRWELSAELFYSPLDVVRPPAASSRTDGLFNARALIGRRLR